MKNLLIFALLLSSASALGQAALPTTWVDNNELTCLLTSNCYTGSPGLSLTAPAYTLTLGTSAGTWSPSAPPTCGLTTLSRYTSNGVGLLNAVADIEGCRTSSGAGIILRLPPTSTDTGTCASGAYCVTAGLAIPQTKNSLATTSLIIQSTADATLAAMLEPIGAGGIQDNLGAPNPSINPGLNNPDLTGKNMYYVKGPQNASGVLSGITTISTNTTTLTAISPGSNVLVYLANGYVSPGNSYVVDAGGAHPETISCTGTCLTVPNQVGLVANTFVYSHAVGVIVTYTPASGAFTLANGTATNISAYNYLQYMPQIQCSTAACYPLSLCTASGMGLSGACTGTIGPDHWQFQDLAISLCPGPAGTCAGSINNQFLVDTGPGATKNATSYAQYAQHIHFRRIWAGGDWTSLSTGTNSVADAILLEGCYYCSVVGSQVSQAIRPGLEGHSIRANGNTLKIDNNWFEGSSSGMFIGGESAPPAWVGYYSGTDVEFRRNRDTFPYAWLGFQCNPSTNDNCGDLPNNNPYYGGANDPWITGATMVYISGTACGKAGAGCLIYVSGDAFHDSTSGWPGNKVTIGGNTYNLDVVGDWQQTCGSYCYPANAPTQIPLKTSCGSSCGTVGSPVAFTMNNASLVRKNCNEFKEGARILISGIVCEDVDNSGGQQGISFANATRTISGPGTTGSDYGVQIKDVTVQGSIFRNNCNGFTNAGGRSLNSSGGVSLPQQRMSFTDILGYSISETNPGCPSGSGYGARLDTGGQSWYVTMSGNGTTTTAVAFASIDAGVSITGATHPGTGGAAYTDYTTTGNTAAQNAALCGGTAGAYIYVKGFGDGNDSPSTSGFLCSASTATSITLANSSGITESGTAAGNPILSNLAPSDSATAGFQVFDILAGDPVYVNGCTNAAFNMPVQQVGSFPNTATFGKLATSGSAPWTQDYTTWTSSMVTVSYLSSASGTDTSGTCILTNTQGSPESLTWNHLTQITDAAWSIYPLNTPGNGGPNFQTKHAFLNSIFLTSPSTGAGLGGWFNNNVNTPREGTYTETFNYDQTSMTAACLVWPGRPAGDYTEFQNNLTYASLSCFGNTCSSPTGCSPPQSWSFPSTSCAVGFAYSCSGNMPIVRSDYHDYALSSGSSYHNTASDATDFGARISNIDADMTQNLYVCNGSCGSPGPYPDYLSGVSPTASTPTFSPVAGTYLSAQSVTISASTGPVICYNTTGSPATNGSTGCTTGILYSSPVAVASSETLYAVAGGTGYTDSAVGSAAYTITSPGPGKMIIQGNAKITGNAVIQ